VDDREGDIRTNWIVLDSRKPRTLSDALGGVKESGLGRRDETNNHSSECKLNALHDKGTRS
jgi:hypothetical protein